MSDIFTQDDLFVEKPETVVVIATGGTIAGVGDHGKSTVYSSGQISGEELLSAIPQIRDLANVKTIQFSNLNSDDITAAHWILMAKLINRLAADPKVKGFVITHGTDTMEETAYFLNLTVKTDKPVVLTGSMRPSTSFSADGPMNLFQAICVAADDKARNKSVMMAFSDVIYSARTVTKASSYSVTAMSGGVFGAIGIVRDGEVLFYEESAKRHTLATEFDVEALEDLPKVGIIYFHADADPKIVSFLAERSEGLIIAGAGAGEYSLAFKSVIEKLDIPVVISSRIDDGMIIQKSLICPGTIAANNLQPHKAAILLRLALTAGAGFDELVRIFAEY